MSQPSLKLTMIGPSGTGKSCYLYATYFRMLEGVAGFNFNCKDFNQGLDLQDAWDMMLDEGVWPGGNTESTNFDFTCFCRGRSIGDFEWLDYRGGVLKEREEKDNDVAKFIQRAQNSDALLVSLPADLILAADSDDLKTKNKWRSVKTRVLALLGKAFEQNPDTALIFLITKNDLCHSSEEGVFCVREIKTAFARYFQGTPEHVMIAATRLGRFEGEGDAFQQGAKIEGNVDPKNVHLPILFPFYLHAIAAAQEFEEKAENAKNERYDYAQRAQVERGKSFWGKLWNGDSSEYYDECAANSAEVAKNYEKKANELNAVADEIWSEFNGSVDIFYQGRCVMNASGVH